MTADVKPAPSLHRSTLKITCPAGHVNGTQKASGDQLRCGGCFQADGTIVLLTVPDRPDDELVDEAALGSRPPITCRICTKQGTPARDRKTPVGWVTITIQTDPASDPKGRHQRVLWPYCSPNCAIAALEKADGRVPRKHPDSFSYRALMSELPAGRHGED